MSVSLKATKRNTTVHVGDGRTFKGPYTFDPAGPDEEEIEGETIHDVSEKAAEAIVKNKLGKIVKAPAEA